MIPADTLTKAGSAGAERLLTDLHSPLFAWAEPGTVTRLARRAVGAMEPPAQLDVSAASPGSLSEPNAARRTG
jgi:hypothetical protein